MAKNKISSYNASPESIDNLAQKVMPVATAIAAFVGYTVQAVCEGESCYHKAVAIRSLEEFEAIFCSANPSAKQYRPQYHLLEQKEPVQTGNYIEINGAYYDIVPDPNTIYYLHNSVKLFYENGGGLAYVVSVGSYGPSSENVARAEQQIINKNVELNDLLAGLKILQEIEAVSMYIFPEATLLSVRQNGELMQAMLGQNKQMQTAISIFDVIGGRNSDPLLYTFDIKSFREHTGNVGLNYGTAYYPFVGTNISQEKDIDYTNFYGGDIEKLVSLLQPINSPNSTFAKLLNKIINSSKDCSMLEEYNQELIAQSDTYRCIIEHVLADINLLPPSGVVAGLIAKIDSERGLWHPPANLPMQGVYYLPIDLTNQQQGSLNVDPFSGKSINAIRNFKQRGILIWGARTLDGNSQDFRYITVRRILIFVEQSCKQALWNYRSLPNNSSTWEAINASFVEFLTVFWKQGGLQGEHPSELFEVQCGLGTTMTAQDIEHGMLKVSLKIAITQPNNFLLIGFEQKMQATI